MDWPVEICAVTLPAAPALTVSLAGVNRQIAFAGSVPHCKVNAPCDPLSGVITSP